MKAIAPGIVGVLLLAVAPSARAGVDNAGTTAANFLSVGSGAGILGMAGTTLGSADDLNGAAWNVASLGWLGETQLVMSHAGLQDQSQQEWAAVGGRLGSLPTRWAVSGLYQGEGTFEGRDASNVPTGSFGVSSMAFGAALAQSVTPNLSLGAGMKYVHEDLGSVTGSGLTFDFGAQARYRGLGVGLAAQNVGGRMSYDGVYYSFPANYGAGVSYDLAQYGLRVGLDLNFPKAYYSDLRTGVEWRWKDRFALRTGYRQEMGAPSTEALTGPSFGMGAGVGGFWLDYGYLVADGGGQHRLGFTMRPGMWNLGLGEQTTPDALRPVPAARRTKLAPAEPAAPKEPATSKGGAPKSEPAAATAKTGSAASPTPPPAKTEPTKTEPAKAEPAKTEPAKAEPAKTEPAKTEPAKAEPAKAEPAKAEPAKTPAPAERPSTITIKQGDTLYSIARRYGTSVAAIMMENNMVNDVVRVGQVLRLPPARR